MKYKLITVILIITAWPITTVLPVNAADNGVSRGEIIYTDKYVHNYLSNHTPNPFFNSAGNIPLQIRQWELNTGYNSYTGVSNRYTANLPVDPWRPVISFAGNRLMKWGMDYVYHSMGRTYDEIANLCRSEAAFTANRIADFYMWRGFSPSSLGNVYSLTPSGNIYAPNFSMWLQEGNKYRGFASYLSQPNNSALINTERSWQIYNTAWTYMNIAISAADRFVKTIDYAGKSMQIMNPPIYLQNNPEFGQFAKFTPAQKTLFVIPASGMREGYGSYSIPHGMLYYQEKLMTAGPYPITKIHADTAITDFGKYYRKTEIMTPAANSFERFAVTHYPVNDYWDPETSTMSVTNKSSISWQEITKHGFTQTLPAANFNSMKQQQIHQPQTRTNQSSSYYNYSFYKKRY